MKSVISFLKVLFTVTIICGLLFLSIGCEGPTGPKGADGVSLIKTYTGTMTGETTQTIFVPEIEGKMGQTYVLGYWTIPTAPTIWTPFTDGSTFSPELWVSWEHGRAYIYLGTNGNLYRLDVYQNN